jgi:hypothetical protein
MPESIGSRKRVLPPGVVCDKCNNYFARKVEHPVLNHSWMRNLRAWHQVPNKKGKSPSLLGHIAGTEIAVGMRRGPDGGIQLTPERLSDAGMVTQVIGDGFERPVIFTIADDDPPQVEMSRFLCKMALEAVAELFVSGPGGVARLVDEPYFDNIRTYARYGVTFKDWPFSQRRIYPIDTLMRHPDTNEWVQAGFGCGLFMNGRLETFFAFVMYGVEFVVNVGGPSIQGYKEWLRENNDISPIVERVGCRLVVEGEGPNKTHYLHGGFEIRKGIEFDGAHGYTPFGAGRR